MKKYHKIVVDFFTEKWFRDNWENFRTVRKRFPKGSFNKEIIVLELSLHPLLREVFKHQSNYNDPLDFGKIYPLGSSDFIFSHLGRDLELLATEIAAHGDRIKKDLIEPGNYEANRYALLIAAGYKLLKYDVEFIASTPSKEKRADLRVKNNIISFLVEAKQRNQGFSDKERYLFFGELTETFLPLLRILNKKDIFLNLEINYEVPLIFIKKQLFNDINKLLWINKKSTNNNFKISLNTLSSNKEFMQLLLEGGHLREYPVYTRTEDGYIASDPINKNVILLNKKLKPGKIPSAIYSLLNDANLKITNGERLILYLDLERADSNLQELIATDIREDFDTYSKDYPNIHGYIISQTLLKFLGKTTIIQPNFTIICAKSKWKDQSDMKNFFGFQGNTGLDDYLIKEFIMPVGSILKKYIECSNCGYKMEGIATDLNKGDLLSQVSLPCLKCGEPMDMTIRE